MSADDDDTASRKSPHLIAYPIAVRWRGINQLGCRWLVNLNTSAPTPSNRHSLQQFVLLKWALLADRTFRRSNLVKNLQEWGATSFCWLLSLTSDQFNEILELAHSLARMIFAHVLVLFTYSQYTELADNRNNIRYNHPPRCHARGIEHVILLLKPLNLSMNNVHRK